MGDEPRAGGEERDSDGAPPRPFTSWSQLYLLVLGVLVLVIFALSALKWAFR